MKNEVIKLNSTFGIDLRKMIDSRLLVQANSGGGKSWLLRRLLEQSHGKVQQIIIDPEGEFSTLREKFDYVLAGKGGDVPAEPRSAALLARKLLEMNVSAIIDIYELPPQERKRFVRLFLDAMVNAPKELWHHCLVVVDEAHVFAPEKDKSEASGAVIDLATRGRKRGFCAILATQRISKLSKDAAAECNNKLIGRSAMDIDMKRAGEELGFTSKEQFFSLRQLEPGEFFAFGPAISNNVEKLVVGDVRTTHPKAGSRSLTKTTPPTERIKKILGKLVDLPAEAAKEAQTVAELKAEVHELRRHKCDRGADPKAIEDAVRRAVSAAEARFAKERDWWIKQIPEAKEILERMTKMVLAKLEKKVYPPTLMIAKVHGFPQIIVGRERLPIEKMKSPVAIPPSARERVATQTFEAGFENKDIGICAKKVYSFLYKNPDQSFTKVQLGAVTGYSPKSGGFNNAIARLNSLGLIRKNGEAIRIGEVDHSHIIEGEEFSAEPRFWERKLGRCEFEIYKWLWDRQENSYSKEEVGEATGYSPTSGGFNNAVSHLNSIGLIRRQDGGLVINPELANL